jgi:3-(3-hydroxy-phenyl)propionate hydroxylase
LLGPGLHGDAPPPAAARAAQPRLADGTRLDDRVGYHFAVLATRRFIEALPAVSRELFADRDPTLVSADGEAADYLAGLGIEAVAIRPDRHVLGVASTATELTAVLARRPRRPRHEGAPRARETAAVGP